MDVGSLVRCGETYGIVIGRTSRRGKATAQVLWEDGKDDVIENRGREWYLAPAVQVVAADPPPLVRTWLYLILDETPKATHLIDDEKVEFYSVYIVIHAKDGTRRLYRAVTA